MTNSANANILLRILSNDKYAAAAAVIFTLVCRIALMASIDDSGDQKYYLNAVKQLSSSDSYTFNHWSARFGIVLPVYIGRFFTGNAAVGTYLIPVVFSLIAAFLTVKICSIYNKPAAGFAAAVLLALDPLLLRGGCQILPLIFSIVYLLACSLFVLSLSHNKWSSLFLSVIFMFLAYETHIINLFFMPGILLMIILNNKEKPLEALRDSVLFCGALLFLFLAETLLYSIATDFTFGRLSIVTEDAHISTLKAVKPYQLLTRFLRPGPYFVAALVASAVITVKCVKAGNHRLLATVLPAASFFIILLFALKSINPLVPIITMDARYVDTGVPFLLIFCCCFIGDFAKAKSFMLSAALIAFLCVCIAGCVRIPNHPLYVTDRLDRQVDNALHKKIPLAYSPSDSRSVEEMGRIEKNIQYINAFFVDDGNCVTDFLSKMPDGSPVLLCVPKGMTDDCNWREYLAIKENQLLLVYRRPQVFREISVGEYMKL